MSEHRHEIPGKERVGSGVGAQALDEPDTLVTDPVCGMKVNPATSKHRFDTGGTTFHFCSGGCRTKLAANSERYLKLKVTAPDAIKTGAI